MMNFLNLELTSRCNKGNGELGGGCWMCGRRKMEREHPELCNWGDMPYELVEEIARQIPPAIVCQFHFNGESLLYPRLGDALRLFQGNIRCFNTNAKLLLEKASEIINNLETLTISVIQDDPEREEQYGQVCKFIEQKGKKKPALIFRLLGNIQDERIRWRYLPGIIARRVLHQPEGSFGYSREPTKPEIGICHDLLTRLAIDRYGNISLCVRFDPQGDLRLGNAKDITLAEAWLSEKRQFYINRHLEQRRDVLPGCDRCHYFGVPRGD